VIPEDTDIKKDKHYLERVAWCEVLFVEKNREFIVKVNSSGFFVCRLKRCEEKDILAMSYPEYLDKLLSF
jgi:hypothetical protein